MCSCFLPDLYDEDLHNRMGALFGEEGHRWIIAVEPTRKSWVRTAAFHYSVPLVHIGHVGGGHLKVSAGGNMWFSALMTDLNLCHRFGLADAIESW